MTKKRPTRKAKVRSGNGSGFNVSVYFPDPEYQKPLQLVATKTGMSESTFMRKLAIQYFSEQGLLDEALRFKMSDEEFAKLMQSLKTTVPHF